MKIYTRTGDAGSTSLVGGKRVSKDSPRLEAYGTVDELNAFLGLLVTYPHIPEPQRIIITMVQNKLFNVGAYLATDNSDNHGLTAPTDLGHKQISILEEDIDRMTDMLPPLHSFILPTGCPTAAMAHVCRTICRRAERKIVALTAITTVDDDVIRFLNRLSDYLFTLARYANQLAGVEETPWLP